ncbi:MAG: hypothetical protein AAGJ37_15445, partial [Pseudomonadota bacterium]
SVTVSNVDLSISEGRLTISNLDIQNPAGFSESKAVGLGGITLDLGGATSEPYVIQEITISSPEMLYEFDESGNGNLLALKDNLQKMLPTSSEPPPPTTSEPLPLVIVENVSVENAVLKLDFENLPTGGIDLGETKYDVTLPTFSAGSVGKPNGIPADQVGAAIADAMLENVIEQAKAQAKSAVGDKAKEKLQEEVDAKKDELKEKAEEKLKNLLGGG